MLPVGEILNQTNRRGFLEKSYKDVDRKRYMEIMVKSQNDLQGDLNDADGYDCHVCHNKGIVFYVVEEEKDGVADYHESSTQCRCIKIRRSIRRMKASGLSGSISKCTFDKYETTEDWQTKIKDKAQHFADNVENLEHKWFFIGGAVGCGKTHICTAIVRELLLKGKESRYMLWVDESTRLKASVNDEAKYNAMINPLKESEVLYIDDFLKITKDTNGTELLPTSADLKLAYEILNYRYQQPELITIISSERHVSEIELIDSAIGSRIYEKTKENACNIARDKKRNYRLRGSELI